MSEDICLSEGWEQENSHQGHDFDDMKPTMKTQPTTFSTKICLFTIARRRCWAMAAALLLLVLLFLGERCGSYGNFEGELDACLGPLLSGRGVTPAPVWRAQAV